MRAAFVGSDPFVKNGDLLSTEALFDAVGGNTGNLAFNYAMVTQVAQPTAFVSLASSAAEIRERADVLVMPLANQLGPHTDLGDVARRLEEIGLPIVGIGLGAQAVSTNAKLKLTPGTERWLKTIADHRPGKAPNIGVRGQFTLEQLDERGIGSSAVVTGCPSNFIQFNPNFLSDIAQKQRVLPSRIAVAAGIPFLPALAKLESDMADLIQQEPGGYIVQHNLKMLWLARGELDRLPPEQQELFRGYIRPGLSMEEFRHWCVRHAVAYFDAERWMTELKSYDFVVGTRFHGAMLAIQAGTPAGCISHDSRTAELCETMAIPTRPASTIDSINREALRDMFPFDQNGYLARRKELCRSYLGIMEGAGIELRDYLSVMADRTPRPAP